MFSASVPNAVSAALIPESGMAHKTGGPARRLRIR
jgi:hypothetical protein